MQTTTEYRVEAWAPDCHIYFPPGTSEPVAEWTRLHEDFRDGQTYFGSYDALQAAKYVARAAEKFYVKVRVLKMERIRTYNEEEVDFND